MNFLLLMQAVWTGFKKWNPLLLPTSIPALTYLWFILFSPPADKSKLALPLNWTPGEKVIVSPTKTVSEILEQEVRNYDMVDFYLAKKDIPST